MIQNSDVHHINEEVPMDPVNEAVDTEDGADDVIEADSLVEEVSIDGMCGVY